MDWKRWLKSPCLFIWLAIHPLAKTEQWWGWMGFGLTVFILLGIGTAALAGAYAPSPLPALSPKRPALDSVNFVRCPRGPNENDLAKVVDATSESANSCLYSKREQHLCPTA